MSNGHLDPKGREVEAILRELDQRDLELFETPDQVWDGIEATLGLGETAPETVVSLDSRRWTGRRVLMGLAAALVGVVIAVGIFLAGNDGTRQVLATAMLAYDPVSFDRLGNAASGNASLVSQDDQLVIEIVDSRLPDPGEGADLEVWLIQPDDEGNVADLVSLGVVNPVEPGVLEIPASHDPAVYYVVDISVEPRDGDASHSGRSILRGPLTYA
ncbi:MAG: anti-sigma factor [Acidimicrobiia bacterium]|nr:anti-sigma factor [Acidimicrobiia bacterium]MYF83406.1 anti-sigma factor [Acidimicrobiia bacterium]